MVVALAAGALFCGCAAPSAGATSYLQVAITPSDTTIGELAAVPHMSVGVMSTGIGSVPAEQTYLDISQGSRIDDALYDDPLWPLGSVGRRIRGWAQILRRAEGAPADILPGLLASTLDSRGVQSQAVPAAGSAALMVASRDGVIGRDIGGRVSVFSSGVGVVRKQATRLRQDGLLIAFAEPTAGNETLPIGIAGGGFEGDLTSDSTRTDGYVLSTDLAPTILTRFGVPIPDEMDGEPIRAEGSVDAAGVESLGARMAAIPDRREPILVSCLLAWSLIAFAVSRIVFGLRRAAFAWLALAFAYMPLLLLLGALLEPSAAVEGLLVGFGAAGLAALTARFAWGWRGLAIASGITVIAYATDVIAGSDLTRLSLLGPNPIFGVRFYGIGNELEALIAVMVPAGVAAGLTAYTGWGRRLSERAAVGAFLGAGVVGAVVFGAGHFGADVGAAIVLPIGAAVSVAALPAQSFEAFARSSNHNPSKFAGRLRVVAAVIAAPVITLILLAFIDSVSGGNSHLTRSVIDAGGASDLADVVERRLRLSAHDFARAARNPLFWIVVVGICVAISRWRRIDAWLRPVPIARAGLIGASTAVAVGVLVNDSGASFLVLGGLALGAFLAFAWSQAGEFGSSPRNPEADPG